MRRTFSRAEVARERQGRVGSPRRPLRKRDPSRGDRDATARRGAETGRSRCSRSRHGGRHRRRRACRPSRRPDPGCSGGQGIERARREAGRARIEISSSRAAVKLPQERSTSKTVIVPKRSASRRRRADQRRLPRPGIEKEIASQHDPARRRERAGSSNACVGKPLREVEQEARACRRMSGVSFERMRRVERRADHRATRREHPADVHLRSGHGGSRTAPSSGRSRSQS